MSLHIFGVRVIRTRESLGFFDFSASRAEGPGLHKTLASWYVYKLPRDDKQPESAEDYLICVKTALPDAWLIGAAFALVPLIFTGLKITGWLVPGAVLLLLSFLTTSTFRYWVMRMGLRRWGYHGGIVRLKQSDVILRLVKWGKSK